MRKLLLSPVFLFLALELSVWTASVKAAPASEKVRVAVIASLSGEAASWVYDGREFKLAEYATMPACTGFLPDDWPVSWTTSGQR